MIFYTTKATLGYIPANQISLGILYTLGHKLHTLSNFRTDSGKYSFLQVSSDELFKHSLSKKINSDNLANTIFALFEINNGFVFLFFSDPKKEMLFNLSNQRQNYIDVKVQIPTKIPFFTGLKMVFKRNTTVKITFKQALRTEAVLL